MLSIKQLLIGNIIYTSVNKKLSKKKGLQMADLYNARKKLS